MNSENKQTPVWYQNLRGFIQGVFPADEKWKAIFLERLDHTFEAGRLAGLEEAASMLDDKAQDYNRIRDPGMANHCRAFAKRIRARAEGKAS